MAAFEDVFDAVIDLFSKPPRRDLVALTFGIAFVVLGVLGLLRAAGVHVALAWLYPAIFVGLGLAGLASAISRGRR